MTSLRRFVVLAAWAFWLGGFVFYTAIVVPVAMRVLERHPDLPSRTQGFVTREVATALNVSGIVAVVLFSLETAFSFRAARLLAWLQAFLVLLMTAGLVILFVLHRDMDRLLDPATESVADYDVFYPLHRIYLWTSTVQWGVGVAYLLLLPVVWRYADARRGETPAKSSPPA